MERSCPARDRSLLYAGSEYMTWRPVAAKVHGREDGSSDTELTLESEREGTMQ
jgi:hypothetical protein